MNGLWEIPSSSIISLSPEKSVIVVRAILRSECHYARLGPSALTISDNLMTPDGGIDAEIDTSNVMTVPDDCLFSAGITGFQIKSGNSFKPWTLGSIRSELIDSNGQLCSEVERLVKRNGFYSVICTGHDLTPKQRNDAKTHILEILEENSVSEYENKVEVLGAQQIKEYAERYPGVASLMMADPIQEAWTLEEWRQDAHMANSFEESQEQSNVVDQIRTLLYGETKHIRVLGEAGLGKTRIVLESLKDEILSKFVLYIEHGSQFGKTKLFRQILKSDHSNPLILVIDELPESELLDVWRHLKARCGHLKLISMDHGHDKTQDTEIERINVPHLSDEVIERILVHRVGTKPGLSRWVGICEGSPRVAQAVADNLVANPSDLLKPPSTIGIWKRFLHGYSGRDDENARQIDCVAQHLALFSRFGFETPVDDEAAYIAELIKEVDPSIGWARFQEIIQDLRNRRVLQGSRTLFFVPKALHIHLWREYWESYGRRFDFIKIFNEMPKSLHTWFMNMFKYAGHANTKHVIEDILKDDGIYSNKSVLISEKGSQFLSILAEANSAAVLRLLENTIGKWSDEEVLGLSSTRQNFVWTIEKIAVWRPYTVRSINLLVRLAVNENTSNANNSTGTLLGLFRIGPELAATEASPDERMPAFLRLLRSQTDAERQIALEVAKNALNSGYGGCRIVGPEYQGLKERAKLWIPKTYEEWWQAYFTYFSVLIDETEKWPFNLRSEVCSALLDVVEHQIRIKKCADLAVNVLVALMNDENMSAEKINSFFWHWSEYRDGGDNPELTERMRALERNYTKRNLASRFNRYVVDVEWAEWDEDFCERRGKRKNRAKKLVDSLAKRVVSSNKNFDEIRSFLAPNKQALGLWFFGQKLACYDLENSLLPKLVDFSLEAKHHVCLGGYMAEIRKGNPELYNSAVKEFLSEKESAWLGGKIAIGEYDEDLFKACLNAFDKGWLEPNAFNPLCYGMTINSVLEEDRKYLFTMLHSHSSSESTNILIDLLNVTRFDDSFPMSSKFVFEVVTQSIPEEDHHNVMNGYHWKEVAQKLVNWDKEYIQPLLEVLLSKMEKSYRLSYDSNVEPVLNALVLSDPHGAWSVIRSHFEETLPKWRSDIQHWLKGGIASFEERESRGVIVNLPLQEILGWIDLDPESRAGLIAHATQGTLDDENGGVLTRELLSKYGIHDGVKTGISATFHSGGWSGSTSKYLKRKRNKLRKWLTLNFDYEVMQWIESEVEAIDISIEREEINEERTRFD